MGSPPYRELVRERLREEEGTTYKDGAERLALLYPSPYAAGMSSLGFLSIYRSLNERQGRVAERAFLPEDVEAYRGARLPLFTYESQSPVGSFPVVALSVAFELEIAGVIEALTLAGIPPLARDRDGRHPYILMGGPLTFSNPLPLAPYADAILLGEADQTVHQALDILFAHPQRRGKRAEAVREEALACLAREIPSCLVPSLSAAQGAGDALPPVARCEDSLLPAYASIRTPNTELREMFLIEAERGCSRGCAYCVMRRSTNGGMRIVPMETILGLVPEGAKKVGLVGAAVSDHPKIAELIERLADQGRGVGISSLRPDKVRPPLVAALKRAGYRSITTASDGSSQRLRDQMQRKAQERHLVRAAELAREHGLSRLKLYMMVGLPGEEDRDIDELIGFATELSRIIPLSLGIAPFVSKRNTPLDGLPYAGIAAVEGRLKRLRRGLKGRVDLRATSARWAWVEHALAQGGRAQGEAVYEAVRAGGGFRDYQRALLAVAPEAPSRPLPVLR